MLTLKKYKFEILLLLFLSFSFFLTFYTTGFPLGGDNWVGRVQVLAGEAGAEIFSEGLGQAFLRPLGPLVAYFFTFFGLDAYSAMLLEDLIFYLVTPFLFFYAANYFFQDKKLAFYSSVFYSASYPFFKYSLGYMTDIGAWFFLILSILLTFKYLAVHQTDPKIENRILWLNPIVCFLGFLMKENGIVGIGFFVLIILLATGFDLSAKFKKVMVSASLLVLLVIIYQIVYYSIFHFNSFDFFTVTKDIYFNRNYNFFGIIKKIVTLFSLGWLYVLLGFYRIFKDKNRRNKIIILSLIPISFSFLLWPYQSERLMAIAVPLLSLLATAGINIKKPGIKFRLTESLLIIIFIVISRLTDYFIINFDFSFLG